MAVVETSTQNIFQRFISSIGGIIIGIIMIFVAIGILFYNDGRENPFKIAQKSEVIAADGSNKPANGTFVSTTGNITTAEPLGIEQAGYFKLNPINTVLIEQKVEMYSWKEVKRTNSKTQLGGSETTTTTYDYEQTWSDDPQLSSKFKETAGHENPPLPFKSNTTRSFSSKIGEFSINVKDLDIRGEEKLKLDSTQLTASSIPAPTGKAPVQSTTEQNTPATTQNPTQSKPLSVTEEYAYFGNPSTPEIGDIRVSFTYLPLDREYTVFGTYENGVIKPHFNTQEKMKLHQLIPGNRDTALALIDSEFQTSRWLLRVVGFVVMWIGFALLTGPLSVILDVIPFFGSASRFVFGIASLLIALPLSIIVIVLSLIVNNLWALLLVLTLIASGVGYFIYSKSRTKAKTAHEQKSVV